jgi:hypothetical protein
MSTHATVHFYEKDNDHAPLLSVYFQSDGYISGVGHALAAWLSEFKVGNGIPIGKNPDELKFANGISCLAAQFIANYKTGPGNLYITNFNDIQEFNYHVFYTKNKNDNYSFNIIVNGYDLNNIFDGTVDELLEETDNIY